MVVLVALQATPDSSPPESPRTPPPPKRGSTTSPGQEALATGARWLAALVCCQHKAALAADALSLVNDLVQLLYYHGSGVAHSLTADTCDTTVHLLSPVVQVSHCCIVQTLDWKSCAAGCAGSHVLQLQLVPAAANAWSLHLRLYQGNMPEDGFL